jgi:hypothetical protein
MEDYEVREIDVKEIIKKIEEDLYHAETLVNVCGYLLSDSRIKYEKCKDEIRWIKDKFKFLKIAVKNFEKILQEVEKRIMEEKK